MPLKLMYITNNLDVALIAEKYGVDRVWIDLETLGKEERQKNLDSVKSHHTVNDIRIIAPRLSTSEMLVRINHWNDNSKKEIDDVINAGAEVLMLPYWKNVDEVKNFIQTVNNRCKTTLLLETKEAVECIDEVLKIQGIDEIHIGLNDLHLSYGLDFMFELLTNGTVEMLCKKFASAGIPYGFGGIAQIGDGAVPAEKIILEHYKLGSTRAILSRSFCDSSKIESLKEIERIFSDNMKKLREYEKYASNATEEVFSSNSKELEVAVRKVAEILRKKKNGVV